MTEPQARSRKFLAYALAVIFTANFFNYIDRQLVSALEKPIRTAFHLDETEYGFLWTLFTLGYMLCAIPIGFLADRFSRTRLFALCIVVWSVATVASGMAQSRWVLYVARILIGVGEAGCLIIGPALISDYFSRSVRGRALSVFYLGLPLGGTAAFILSGSLLKQGWDWRDLFTAAGIPGFAIAALIAFLPDPPRGAGEGAGPHGHRASLREYLQLFRNRTLLLIILAQAFAVMILVPLIHFGVEFFVQVRGMKEDDARIALGVMALIAGALGNSLSGVIGDRLSKRTPGGYALLAAVGFLSGLPCLMTGFYAPSPWIFLPALTLGCFFYFLCMPAVNTQIANVVSPGQRATAWALAVFVLHLLGDTFAAPVFGAVSQGITRQHAFAAFSSALVLSGLCCLLAWKSAPRDIQAVERRSREEGEAGSPDSVPPPH